MQYNLYTKDVSKNINNVIQDSGFSISLLHLPEDPVNANRIKISYDNTVIDLLPSKGLSLGQAWIKGQSVFWEAPIILPDTETIDLWSDEVCINGNPAKGFTFLKTLVAGVELYGLSNWGMPVEKDLKLQPLHGETSNIPVDKVSCSIEDDCLTISASFDYRTFEGDMNLPWYQRGEALYKVTKKVMLKKSAWEIKLEDTIENISNRSLTPDWGYHITFRAEDGTQVIVPSAKTEVRGGGLLSENYNIWKPGADMSKRTESGIIYKELHTTGENNSVSAIKYPDGSYVEIIVPQVPYFQTWICAGGKGSNEFTFKNGESLLHKNWDGIGIEIGSSALDHDGNIDRSFHYQPDLEPGQKLVIPIGLWLHN